MSIGMTYEQYYYGTPYLVQAYSKAHRLRQKEKNFDSWLQGRYMLDALNVAMSGFGSKGQKPKYPEKPYDIYPKTKEEREIEARKAREKVIANLNAWKKQWDKQKENKETG